MYSKKFRLPIKKKAQAAKKIFSSPYFLAKMGNNGCGHNRFGIIIPSASVGKSTKRHHWKRIIADRLRAMPNLEKDFLLIVLPGIEEATRKNMGRELDRFSNIVAHAANNF